MDSTHTKALAIDGAYVAVVGSSPFWMQFLEQWAVLLIIALALIVGVLRAAIAWREWRRGARSRR